MRAGARADRRAVGMGDSGGVTGVVDRRHGERVGAGGRVERLAVRHRSGARGQARAAEVGAGVVRVDGLALGEDGTLRGRRQRDRRRSSVDRVGVVDRVRVAVGVRGIDRECLRAGGRGVDRGAVCDVAVALGDRSERAGVGAAGDSRRGRRRGRIDAAGGRRRERDGGLAAIALAGAISTAASARSARSEGCMLTPLMRSRSG